MAGATLYVDFDDAKFRDVLSRVRGALDGDGMHALLERVGNHLFNSTRARAEQQVAPDGTPWAALSPRYQRRKAKTYPGRRILQREGHMLGDRLNYQVTEDTLLLGTSGKSKGGYEYPVAHQFGRGPVRARPFLGLSLEDEEAVLDIVEHHLSDALNVD